MANRSGGFLLAGNHISHFDPFIISSVVRRKIDWMAMAEFFPMPVVGLFLRAVDAFPADRHRANRHTIRTAVKRLKAGRIVGIFPEGGIRDGQNSILEGAPLKSGASALADMASVPILPCVIIGSDRLYAKRNWLPFRRTPVWIAFGDPIPNLSDQQKPDGRERTREQLATALKHLYAELRQTYSLTPDDLPHPPRQRMNGGRSVPLAAPEPRVVGSGPLPSGLNTAIPRPRDRGYRANPLRRLSAASVDALMCASINLLQARHRLSAGSRETMERYVNDCEKLALHEYYGTSAPVDLNGAIDSEHSINWQSPITTKFPANNVAKVNVFRCAEGWKAPTVLMLHALMSATQIGYRRWAARFNELGWNACFVHLPYHYSRVPPGHWNGELAITADLVRNAEGLRQGVMELRQLLSVLRTRGCTKFGILGTSYGAWIGALLACVERDLHFVALMAPIVDVHHAIWESGASVFMRRELRRANIEPALVARHFRLSSALHNQPACPPDRVLFVAGEFDVIARPEHVREIHQKWRGSELLTVRQGHFGYRMIHETFARLRERGFLNNSPAS